MAGLGLLIHGRFEEAERSSTICFCSIQRHIGVLQQHFRVSGANQAISNAHTGADGELMSTQVERLAEHLDDPDRESRRLTRLVGVYVQDGKLVTSKSYQSVIALYIVAQPLSNGTQERIASRVAKCVIYVPKRSRSRQVQLHCRRVDAATGLPAQEFAEHHAVGQSGQYFVVCHVASRFSTRRRSVTSSCVDTQPPSGIGR